MKYLIGYIGEYDSLPEPALSVYEHDIDKLEKLVEEGTDLSWTIRIGQWTKLTPLEIAVYRDDVEMVKWLTEHGANTFPVLKALLNAAVRCCGREMIEFFMEQIQKLGPAGKNELFSQIQYGERFENIEILEENGITVAEYGGEAFRSAASKNHMDLVRMYIEKGVDVNYHEPDMVIPYASTAVTLAARQDNMELVKYLVENGADVTIIDKNGDRPYTFAVKNKNQEMIEYLTAIEPEKWHNEQEKDNLLKPYKLPKEMVEYLKTGELHITFPECRYIKAIELYSYMDLQELRWKRKKYLSIAAAIEDYSDLLLVWYAKAGKLLLIDLEHEQETELCGWEEFIKAPGVQLNKIFV